MAVSFPLIGFIILTKNYLISLLTAKILVISGLDSNNAHGHDMISIRLLKRVANPSITFELYFPSFIK